MSLDTGFLTNPDQANSTSWRQNPRSTENTLPGLGVACADLLMLMRVNHQTWGAYAPHCASSRPIELTADSGGFSPRVICGDEAVPRVASKGRSDPLTMDRSRSQMISCQIG